MGCTDTLYFEYDSIATINDGSCETLIVYGCTDQDYLEYWSYDTLSFSISILDLIPNLDNGSCENLVVYGCTNSFANNYNTNSNVDNGSCIISGCIDPFAQNTDSLANLDDGSCLYDTSADTLDNNSNVSCEIPTTDFTNTGVNMTVFFTSGAISTLPLSSDSPYVVVSTPEGLTVGSASFASADLIGGQQSVAVWGDDTTTPEIDGALNGEELTFQLIDGNSLYDLNLSFGGLNSFTTNGQLPVIASSAELNCSSSSSNVSCEIPQLILRIQV